MPNIDLSVIILSYKSKRDLSALLPSLYGSNRMVFSAPSGMAGEDGRYLAEVIVVDNGSGDGTYEWLAQSTFPLLAVQNTNTGFAAGNNVGIKKASGAYVLLLNPDTRLEPDTLCSMLDFMRDRPDVGMSGCKLVKADGTLDLACRRRFPNPWNSFSRLFLRDNRSYNYSDIDENTEMEVDSVVGAFLLTRREVIDKIGLLDETFFMYGEDLDWCLRCKLAGYKVWYYPKVICHHFKGESSKKVPFLALKWFHDAMWIFYRKHYAKKYPFFFNGLVWLAIYARLAALTALNAGKKHPTVSS